MSQNLPLKRNLTQFESQARARGYHLIAGVDEAGRGPLAGPVCAAACIIDQDLYFPGINDSKLLTDEKRRYFYHLLTTHPKVIFGIGLVGPALIDKINILQATLQAMAKAVKSLSVQPDIILVDGINEVPHKSIPSQTIKKGDQQSQSIAAASIIAKVYRDDKMLAYHKKYPKYGFDAHKGYGTQKHREALKRYGPTAIHRMSFAPVKACGD